MEDFVDVSPQPPSMSRAELKWRAWCRLMMLLCYLRPVWATIGHYLTDYTTLDEPEKLLEKEQKKAKAKAKKTRGSFSPRANIYTCQNASVVLGESPQAVPYNALAVCIF